MLKIRNLYASYGRIEALHGINITVPDGAIVSVIGSNGAGKTTLLGTISGLIKSRWGQIVFDGATMPPQPHKTVAAGIVHVPEGRRIFSGLSVNENLTMGAFRASAEETRERRQRVFDIFPRLRERADQIGGTLSGGEQQMLAIGRGLMAGPRLMLLDEPSLGLAPLAIKQVFAVIREINEQGVTVVVVEQNAHMALGLADYAYVLENGHIVLEGSGKTLLTNPRVEQAYLGGSVPGLEHVNG